MTFMSARWTLDDIPWGAFDPSKVSPAVLALIKAAAMVERNGADYGRYLQGVFHDDPEFRDAAAAWAKEEEQHGIALGRWVELADPEFRMDERFKHFTSIYKIPTDVTQSIRGSKSNELCARCVVETGTSSLYSAVRDAVSEPVLKAICTNIAADEFRHYKLFFTYMERALAAEQAGKSRWARIKTAIGRFRETDDDELASAYFAGNALPGAYDRVRANDAYLGLAFGFYKEHHVQRAAHMFANAAGLDPEGFLARIVSKVMWWIIERRGRAYRPQLVGA
jgi:rubrerythrin